MHLASGNTATIRRSSLVPRTRTTCVSARRGSRRALVRTGAVIQNSASVEDVEGTKKQQTLLQTLLDKVDAGIIKLLDIKDTQPEEVKSLKPDEIKKCIQYGAWAWAAYEPTTQIALGTITRDDVMKACGPTKRLLQDKLVILSGSSTLDLRIIFRRIRKSDTQALVGLFDDNKGGVEAVVAFRGSEQKADDWLTDMYIDFDPASTLVASDVNPKLEVHAGFTGSANDFLTDKTTLFYGDGDITDADRLKYSRAIEKQKKKKDLSEEDKQALEVKTIKSLKHLIEKLADDKKISKVVCCGHSLGGALATLTAYWCKKVGWPEGKSDVEVECYTFGAPRVANEAFAKVWDETVLNKNPRRVFRVMHREDPVPGVPGANIPIPLPGDLFDKPYHHVGGGVVLCQPGLEPMVGAEGRPKKWPELAVDKVNGYQAQERRRPITLGNTNAGDHDIKLYVTGLISALENHPSNA